MKLRVFAQYSSIIVIVIGLFLIIGTKLQWGFLVDPPEEWCPFYSHSWLKKTFGADFLTGFNYVVGIGFVVLGLLFLYVAFKGKIVYGR